MSRRRRPAPPLLPGYSRVYTTAVVCTDRGQHPEVALWEVIPGRDVPVQAAVVCGERAEGSPVSWDSGDGTRTYRFHCRRCGRDLQLQEEKLVAVLAVVGGDRSARTRFDLSVL